MGFLSFIGDAISDIFGGTTGRRDQQKYNLQNMAIQQDYARQTMADQNYYNVQAFERENEYNSPVAQMQRNYAAGINPLWNDGGQVVGQQDSVTSPAMPSGGMPSAGNTDFLGTLAQLLSLKSSVKKAESESELNKAKEDEIRAKTPGEVVNLEANTKALLATAFKNEQEATYYYTDLVKKWEHLGFENMSLQTAIKRIDELLPYDKEKMSAETQQATMAAALSFILAKCKPQEVAIEQQNANANTRNAETNAVNAKSNRILANASMLQAGSAQWKAEHEWTASLIHESNVHEMNKIMQGHYYRIDKLEAERNDFERIYKEVLGKESEARAKNFNASTAIAEYDIARLRYRRVHHIDSQMEDLKLEMFRQGIYELESRKELNRQTADKLAMEIEMMPFTLLGNMSSKGVINDPSPHVVNKSKTWDSKTNTWYEHYQYNE